MNLRSLILVCLLPLLAFTALAQKDIRITVWDKDTHQPIFLAYANVSSTYQGAFVTVQTDELGIAVVRPEAYPCKIEVAAIGYEPYIEVFNVHPVNPNINIQLSKKFSSLNEVVVTGLSTPEKLKNALSVYQVIPKAMIQAQGAVTLNDILKNQLNMRISTDNVLGSSVGMQGMTGSKVKILIDGIPVNGREGGNINTNQLNLNNIERIEMIQGPMSVVYGTDALGGVINLITKKENKPFGINIGTYVESIGKYNVDGTATIKLKKNHQFTLGGGRNFFQGWKNIDTPVIYDHTPYLYKRSLLFNPIEQYIGNLAYAYSAKSGFNLQFSSDYLKEKVTDRGNLGSVDPFFGAYAFDEYYRTTRLSNRLSLNGKLGKTGTWQSQNGYVVYYRNRTRVRKDLVTLEEMPTSGKGDHDTSRFNDVYLRSSYSNKTGRFSYTAGYDINLQYAYSLKINGIRKDIQDYASYANASMPFLDNKLVAQIGVRGSYNSSYNPPIIPNVSLLYSPNDKLQFRGSYTQGYRAPSLKEMYLSFIDNNHYIVGNLNLKAEHTQHIQASASYQVFQKKTNYLQLILTGYHNNVQDGIVLVPLNPLDTASIQYVYGNLSEQQNLIGSLQVDGQLNNFHFQLGYSYNHTFSQSGYYNAFSASEATATLQYAWKKPGLNFNVFYKVTGAQPFMSSNIDGSVSYIGKQEAFHLSDASIEKKLWDKRLHLIVGVKNLFDVQRLRTSGIAVSGAHGGGVGTSFLPRSLFTTLRLSID